MKLIHMDQLKETLCRLSLSVWIYPNHFDGRQGFNRRPKATVVFNQLHDLKTSQKLHKISQNYYMQSSWTPGGVWVALRHLTFLTLRSLQNSQGFTALHLAAGNGHVEVVQPLLEAKAAVDAHDNKHGLGLGPRIRRESSWGMGWNAG